MSDLDKKEDDDVRIDFTRCYTIVNKLASLFPEEDESWKGTVSQRLKFLVNKILDETHRDDIRV